MDNRRTFLTQIAALSTAAAAPQPAVAESDRAYWVRTMSRIAEPVLTNLAAGTLKRNMPIESTGNLADRFKYSHLEAIGRLLAGIAPLFETPLDAGPERDLQQRYADLARRGLRNAADPAS